MALFGRGKGGGAGEGPVEAEALVLSSDCGFSAMSWWVTTAHLLVTVPGRAPAFAAVGCTVHREKSLLAGSVLPVLIDPAEPERLKISWEDVPTIDQRIVAGDPVILDPERSWQSLDASRRAAPAALWGASVGPPSDGPHWGDGRIEGWPPREGPGRGRRAGTALVVASSIDSRGYRSGDDWHFPISRYAGTIYDTPHEYLGWLVLCVVPESGRRYGLHVRKMLRSTRLGSVLPVAIDPDDPADVEIPWLFAPDLVRAGTSRMQAANRSAVEAADQRLSDLAVTSDAALEAIADPAAREQAEEMMSAFGTLGAPAASAHTADRAEAGGERDAVLARLERLRSAGALSEEEFRAQSAKLKPGS